MIACFFGVTLICSATYVVWFLTRRRKRRQQYQRKLEPAVPAASQPNGDDDEGPVQSIEELRQKYLRRGFSSVSSLDLHDTVGSLTSRPSVVAMSKPPKPSV